MRFGYRITKRSDRISRVARLIEEEVAEILADVAEQAASIAQQLAPFRTGALRDSIAVEQTGVLGFRVIAGAPYSAFVELGTVNMDAQPFLGPAIESVREQLIKRLSRVGVNVGAKLGA